MEVLSSRILLRPQDPEGVVAFYRDVLGLAIAREYPAGTVFHLGNGLLEVAAHGQRGGPPGTQLWLQVRDAAAELDAARRRGAPVLREARTEPWGLIEAWVVDPEGMPIVLVEIPAEHPLRADRRE